MWRGSYLEYWGEAPSHGVPGDLRDFMADAIREAVREAVRDERTACALVADDYAKKPTQPHPHGSNHARAIADAIRARNKE